jgi:hypothetical protein
VWFFFGGRRWSRLNFQSTPLFEFRLPPEYYPASPSRPAAASQLLPWTLRPYSTSGTEGHLSRALPARNVPPSGFDYPLDGFRPSIPRRFCFAPAALLGFTLRSFLLPKGRPYVSAPAYPPTVPPASETTYRSRRPALQAAVSGHCPSGESLAAKRGFSTSTAGCSPGFRPSRVRSRRP